MSPNNLPTYFSAILPQEKNDYLNLIVVGWEKCTAEFTYSQYRDMYIIHYIKSGCGTIEKNRRKYQLSANDAFIVRPKELLIQTADKQSPWELYYFAFNGKLAEQLLEKTVFCNSKTIAHLDENDFPETISSKTIELNDSSPNEIYNLECLSQLLAFFDIKKMATLPTKKEHNKNQQYILFVKEYIEANYFKSIKISEIADQLHINRSYLYRIFKDNTNISIQDYLVSIRLNKACTLLNETSLSASSISGLVGYSHYPTFFKIFKRFTGLTPVEYRNQKNNNIKIEQPL